MAAARRPIFRIFSAVSLALCLATAAVWLASYPWIVRWSVSDRRLGWSVADGSVWLYGWVWASTPHGRDLEMCRGIGSVIVPVKSRSAFKSPSRIGHRHRRSYSPEECLPQPLQPPALFDGGIPVRAWV